MFQNENSSYVNLFVDYVKQPNDDKISWRKTEIENDLANGRTNGNI